MAGNERYNVRISASHSRSLGMTHRTTPLACSWTGDMRARFSDFQVHEISKDGTVLHLRTKGFADYAKKPNDAQDSDKLQAGGSPMTKNQEDKSQAESALIQIPSEEIKVLEDLAGAKFTQGLVQLFNNGSGPASGHHDAKVTSDIFDDKAKRARLHGEVRRIFKSLLDTSTNPDGAIVASYVSPRKNARKSRGRRGQPAAADGDESVAEYLHFTLYKDNRDTMDAVNQISRLLRIKPQNIGYAGTKDRRASTTQRCSVRHQRKRAMAGLNDRLWGITTGDYQYRDEPIHLGQLLGNEFVITLKNCKLANEDPTLSPADRLALMRKNIGSALEHMAAHGWINYFGHQRFGTHDVGTHQIGKLILSEKFEDAVKALLQYHPEIAEKAEAGAVPDEPSERDEHLRHQACMLFLTGRDLERAAKIIPRRFAGESCVLRHLTRMGKNSARDFSGSITHITRGLRSMYLHAYQSHVWNHVASHRFALHGKTVIPGDLVLCDAEPQLPAAETEQDEDGDAIINPMDDEDNDAPLRARPLTEEEAHSGKYTIHDVVLPSPGYAVIYPENEIGEFYKEFMARAENGRLDPHRMRRLRREFSLPGRYRKLMQRFLSEPTVQVRLYKDDTEQMHPTDMDLLLRPQGQETDNGNGQDGKRKRELTEDGDEATALKKARALGDEIASASAISSTEQEPQDGQGDGAQDLPVEQSSRIAVVVKFQLASSAYATVALRELMGDDGTAEEETTS